MDLSAFLSGNFSVNFASGNQDEESPSEEFDTVNAKRQWEMLLCRGHYFRNFTVFDSKSRIPMQLEDGAVSDYAAPSFY